ncbi:MAG TPA: G5 domain-containing protein, partial [Neobacillus sp.]
GIYQTILPTNFTIIERNIGNTLPDFVNLGYEAKVNLERNSDLVFSNPNQAKYHLAIQLENKRLRVTLTGEKFLYNYKISVKDEQKLTPKTIVQYSPLLVPGKIKVLTKGAEGMIVKIYREVYQGDQMVSSILISEDYYPPLYQVEIHALTSNQQGTTPTNEKQGDASTGDQTTDKQTTPSDQTQQGTNVSDLWGKPNELPK